jgi:hypothetical protein
MYIYRYINKYEQFGSTHYTLILDDVDDIMPSMRIEKKFKIDNNKIDDDFLFKEAKKEICYYTNQFKNSLINTDDNIVNEEGN